MPSARQPAGRQPDGRQPDARQPQSGAPLQLYELGNISAAFNSGGHVFPLGEAFSGATSYSISAGLEAGWSFNTSTGELTIDTDAEVSPISFTVTATSADGSTVSNAFTVRVVLSIGAQFFTNYAPNFFFAR